MIFKSLKMFYNFKRNAFK